MTAKKENGDRTGNPDDDKGREERTASLAAMWQAHMRALEEAANEAQSGEAPEDDDRAEEPPDEGPGELTADTSEDSGAPVTPPDDAQHDPPHGPRGASPVGPRRDGPVAQDAAAADEPAGDWFSEGGAFPGLPGFMQSGPDGGDGKGQRRKLGVLGAPSLSGAVRPSTSRSGTSRSGRGHAPVALVAAGVLVASAAVAGAAYVGDLGFVSGLVNRSNLPNLGVRDARGPEDAAVPLSIDVEVAPGTELTEVIVAGVPDGAVLSAGTEGAPGRWILLPPANDEPFLANLTLIPAENFNGTMPLSVTAVARDGEERVESSVPLAVVIEAVADAPSLRVADAAGPEDTPVTLDITAAVADPQERLVVTITDVPDGATISQGEDTGDGVWLVPSAALAALTLIPAENYKGEFTLRVTAEATDHEDRAALSRTMDVAVQPVADLPDLEVAAVAGQEDVAIPLQIVAQLTDASETMSLRVAGLPDGASLTAGERQADGAWTLSSDDTAELAIQPPANFNGALNFTVAATSQDGADRATSAIDHSVDVAPVADQPNLAVVTAAGLEDEAIALTIAASPAVSGEGLVVTIGDVPPGAALSAGTAADDGQWTVDAADLGSLELTPPENFSGLLGLSITAESTDGIDSAVRSARLDVAVTAVADTPVLELGDVSGPEDSAIPLAITVTASDTSEELELRIEGVPGDAQLSAGTVNETGAWIVPVADIGDLRLTPAANFSGSMSLPVVATSLDGADRAEQRAILTVTATPVADRPVVTTADVLGVEDQAHSISITAAPADASEQMEVVLSGIPGGAALSAGERVAGGTWFVPVAELAGLELLPPEDFNGRFDIAVTAVAFDGDDSAETRQEVRVVTAPAADTPDMRLANASGLEDAAIALEIAVDVAASETATVIVENMPEGATLTAGRDDGDGRWTVAGDDLADLGLIPPQDFKGTFNLDVTAEARDGDDTAVISVPLAVSVAAVADPPELLVQDAAGLEDGKVPLVISPALGDASEVLTVVVAGLPAGAALSAGENAGDGDAVDGSWLLSPADLAGLTMTPPRDFHGEIALYVTATAADGATRTTVGRGLAAAIASVVDQPNLAVQAATGTEDTEVALAIDASPHDPQEGLQVTVGGVPAGGVLSAGRADDAGNWILAATDLTDLMLTPPLNFSGLLELEVSAEARDGDDSAASTAVLDVDIAAVADIPRLSVSAAPGTEDTALPLIIEADGTDASEVLSIAIAGLPAGSALSAGEDSGEGTWLLLPADLAGLVLVPPANLSGALPLEVTARSRDGDDEAVISEDLNLVIDAVADAPRLITSAASGAEDTAVPMAIASRTNDPSEELQVTVEGIPEGGSLTAGLHLGDGTWEIAAEDLPELALVPPANYSGVLALQATATSRDGDDAASITETIAVAVTPVADAPELTVVDAAGDEDRVVALLIDATAADDSEELSVRIAGLPDGAELSAGSREAGGDWLLTPAELEALSLTPPPHFSGVLQARAVAQSRDGAELSEVERAFQVNIAGIADTPRLAATAIDGVEDQPSPVLIDARAADPSEALTVAVSGLPEGATLSAGVPDSAGGYVLTTDDLADLWLTPPENFSGAFDFAVTAVAADGDDTASAETNIAVSITGVADGADVVLADALGDEDTPVAVDIKATAEDASEVLTLSVLGVPPDATLSAGVTDDDGRWHLTMADLPRLTMAPPPNFSGVIPLTIDITARDGADALTAQRDLVVTVQPRADVPALEISDALGIEDGVITLDIAAAPTDESETLSITVSGLPAAAELTAGTAGDDGTWVLSADDLPGLALRLPRNFNGSFQLVAGATANDGGETATRELALNVLVAPVADPPTLVAGSVTGAPGEAIALPVTVAPGTDGERVAVAVTGLVDGATLSNGTLGADGAWQLADDDLANLSLTAPTDYRGSFRLVFEIAAIDGNDRKEIEQTVDVVIGSEGETTAPLALAEGTDTREDLAPGPVEPGPVEPGPVEPRLVAEAAAAYVEPPVDEVAAVNVPAASPATTPVSRLRSMTDGELADLTQRGDAMLQVGDIFAARLLFELAAREGFAAAELGLGKTFDPVYHEEAGVVGAAADPEAALRSYINAENGGNADATGRLDRLRAWMTQNAPPGSIGPAG